MVVSLIGVQKYGDISPLLGTGWVNHATTMWLYLILGAIMGGLIVTPTYLIVSRINKQTTGELLRWAFIVTSAGVIAILLVEIAIKPTFQRERFRFLYAYGNITGINDIPTWSVVLSNGKWVADPNGVYGLSMQTGALDQYGGFHPWYALPITPYGYGSAGNLPFISEDASKSFPSGHETMASVGFYSLILLPFTVKQCNTKTWRISCFTTAICGCVLVALGRMIAGAHYLSDVTVGNFLAMALLFIFYVLYCFHAPHLNEWTGLKLQGKFMNKGKRA
jgi:membrane-associated phospholipid phosphatase